MVDPDASRQQERRFAYLSGYEDSFSDLDGGAADRSNPYADTDAELAAEWIEGRRDGCRDQAQFARH